MKTVIKYIIMLKSHFKISADSALEFNNCVQDRTKKKEDTRNVRIDKRDLF